MPEYRIKPNVVLLSSFRQTLYLLSRLYAILTPVQPLRNWRQVWPWLQCNRQFVVFYIDRVGLCLWTAATNGPIVRPPHDVWVWRDTVEWYWQEKTEELGEKPVPVPLCPPHIPHGLTCASASERSATNRLSHGTTFIDYDGVRLCLRTASNNGPIVDPPGDMWEWSHGDDDAGWGITPDSSCKSSLAVLPAETSGASRRNGRRSENFASSVFDIP
jgi:hypothetical protein